MISEKIWKVFQAIGIIAVVSFVLVLILLISIRSCGRPEDSSTPKINEPGNEFRPPVETYTRPVVRIPFTKPRLPVDPETLPVHPSRIEKTIQIETTAENSRRIPVTLIVDKTGRIYKTKSTPEDIKIITTEWERPVFEIKSRFAYALVWAGDLYNCLSLDLVRIWRIHAGVEIGTQAVLQDFLIGLSGRFEITENMKLLAGRDFLGSQYYAGVQFSF